MKNINRIIIIFFASILVLPACKKEFKEYETDPNRATKVNPELIFRGIGVDMNADRPWSSVSRWNQFDCCNYNYYGDQRYDWGGADLSFETLYNEKKMEDEAKRLGGNTINPYTAIGKFIKAFLYYNMTNLVGDLPMTEALKGKENLRPTYDTQKAIFIQILKWLDDSNTELQSLISKPDLSNTTNGQILAGDIYYNSKLEQWQKAVNAFRLRVLIALSKKVADTDLNVKQQFAAIVSNPAKYPLFTGIKDNLQFTYSATNKYPSNPDNLGFDATRYNLAATYLNTLVELNDPRVYMAAEPATKQLAQGKTPATISAYVGAPSGEDLQNMSKKMSNVDTAEYSVRSRSRYYTGYTVEPGVIVGYAEMCFNIAEAINHGWMEGNAETWYKNGIVASLSFYGIPVKDAGIVTKVYKGVSYNIPFDFNAKYYTQSTVAYKGNNAEGLTQILTQKYLAFFQNSGREAYFNWRRTNMPTFSLGTGTGNGARIPLRYQYPSSERTTNEINLNAAVQRQYGGKDDINAQMWLIK